MNTLYEQKKREKEKARSRHQKVQETFVQAKKNSKAKKKRA